MALLFAIIVTPAWAASPPPAISPAVTTASAGLVDIRSLVPDIGEVIHYAGKDNFTGAVVDGYRAPKCFLLRPAAEALAHVERDLRKKDMRLQIFDCYRPARAVAAFVRWASSPDQSTRAVHYPNVPKSALLGEYIAPVSGHSRGATLDLTLMQCHGGKNCAPLDMGTGFDFFDPLAHTDAPGATPVQHANRERLLKAMGAEGFENYAPEWWHFTLKDDHTPNLIYDAPVE
ncbi:MAG TPA: M15 family metallopeptidase [Pinirhizobacter sp.]